MFRDQNAGPRYCMATGNTYGLSNCVNFEIHFGTTLVNQNCVYEKIK
jgi:hypothetical protein